MNIINQIKQFLGKSKEEFEYLKSSGNPDAARFLDKRFLISAGVFLVVALSLYFYIVVFVYDPTPKSKNDGKNIRKYNNNISNNSTNQIIRNQTSVSLYSSMKKNNYSIVPNTQEAADINKVPAKYMAVSDIPTTQFEDYIKVFDVVYDFFNEANKGNYQNALLYLNNDFVAKNKITADMLSKYFKETYFEQFAFVVNKVEKSEAGYTTRLLILNKDTATQNSSFGIIYNLNETNGKYDISINDLAKYANKK